MLSQEDDQLASSCSAAANTDAYGKKNDPATANEEQNVDSASATLKPTPRACGACKLPVRDHPSGQGVQNKCLQALVNAMTCRLDCLETQLCEQSVQLREQSAQLIEQERTHILRQEALMAMIAALEDRMERREERDRTPPPQQNELQTLQDDTSTEKRQEHCAKGQGPRDVIDQDPAAILNHDDQSDLEPGLPGSEKTASFDSNSAAAVGDVDGRTLRRSKRRPSSPTFTANTGATADDAKRQAGNDRDEEMDSDDSWALRVSRGPRKLPYPQTARPSQTNGSNAVRRGAALSGVSRDRLKGSTRVSCKPFHLAGISLESRPEDVVAFCRQRNVVVTGCYCIPTRVWGTQSMKLFLDESAECKVLDSNFWPEFVKCRVWTREPPARSHPNGLLPSRPLHQ